MSERDDQCEYLITDLMYLRKGSGFTANRAYVPNAASKE